MHTIYTAGIGCPGDARGKPIANAYTYGEKEELKAYHDVYKEINER